MRRTFFKELYKLMKADRNIIALTGDLGYKGFDDIRDEIPEQFINTGAAEQCLLDMAVGAALKHRIPIVYSITPFLVFRAMETIRLYVNHEKIPIKMIGSGRNGDYDVDGFSHYAGDIKAHLDLFKEVVQYYPETKEEIPAMLKEIIYNGKPCFLSLKR